MIFTQSLKKKQLIIIYKIMKTCSFYSQSIILLFILSFKERSIELVPNPICSWKKNIYNEYML